MKTVLMKTILLFSVGLFLGLGEAVQAQQAGGDGPSIVGRWVYKDDFREDVTEFRADGSFVETIVSSEGRETYQGRYALEDGVLSLQANHGALLHIRCRFNSADSVTLSYPNGTVITAKRMDVKKAVVKAAPTPAPSASVAPSKPTAEVKASGSPAKAAASSHPARVLLHRQTEPNERAFTVLVPDGWKTSGGIFNVNPAQTNGPANSITPKCDFTVKNDDAGTIMLRWIPTWNYADMSKAPSSQFGLFQPGSFYQGMRVCPRVSPEQFLLGLLQQERPGAENLRVVAQTPLPEIVKAFQDKYAQVNETLRQSGLATLSFDALSLMAEYTENGRKFREVAVTAICNNPSAYMWSNECTVIFRAPAEVFDHWKPVLDMVRQSRQVDPRWLAAVVKNGDERAQKAWENQMAINRTMNEILEHRRKTHAEIRHEDYLMLTGQEEYKNPYTGEVETGSSAYPHRWQNNRGDVLYSDENSFDPNQTETKPDTEWKRSEIWDRKQ